ncbi:MAG: tRNA pseudouridine(38-40) synthase TruA [Fimbriimonadaceae bacterium]
MSTNRIQLVVQYDGVDFCGWAAQSGQRTVQGTLTEAVRQISGEACEIVGASRTDSGAHALGQVAHFDCSVPIEPERWSQILNRRLPPDLAVVRSRAVHPEFHSRFWARDRWYRYRIGTGRRDPRRSRYRFEFGRPLDVEAMAAAAPTLTGERDFRAFTAELDPSVENTVRTLRQVKVAAHRDEVWIDVVGTAFLRGMMRRIAGSLLELGSGRRTLADWIDLVENPGRRRELPQVLPANGLTLIKVRYGRHPKDCRRDSDKTEQTAS